jgi:hypothetical protein
MRFFIPSLLRQAGILALLFCSIEASQANTRHQGWYQVEMIVFARRHVTTEEQWPKTIKLRYPTRWVNLKNPDSLANAIPDSNAISSSGSIDLASEPYWQLPATERALNNQARALERNPDYQLLFHQAWRQQITSERQASAILINGGKTYGKHQELEGSITLSVATYLKISTNLWFSQFDPAPTEISLDMTEPDADTNQWPEIPLRPDYISSTIAPTSQDSTQSISTEQASPLLNLPVAEEKDPYIPRLIVLMKQMRDMRSSEVHYLDHPLLGVVIKITPYRR